MKITQKGLRLLIKEAISGDNLYKVHKQMGDLSNYLQMKSNNPSNRQVAVGQMIDVLKTFLFDEKMDYTKLKTLMNQRMDSVAKAYKLGGSEKQKQQQQGDDKK